MVRQAFLWWLRWVLCCGWRGQPSSLHVHQPSSYMIYSVYTKALNKNEHMPCSVKRSFSSAHTNKLLPAHCIDFKGGYVKSVAESTNTPWDVPVSASHHQRPLRSMADVPSAASDVYQRPCCSLSADDLFEFRQIPLSLNLPAFDVQGPSWKTERWEDKVWQRGESQGGCETCIWTAKPGLSSRAFRINFRPKRST